MKVKNMQKYSKFPTYGELLNLLIKSLGINDDINNTRISRFEKEEEISVTEYNDILNMRIQTLLSPFFEDTSGSNFRRIIHIVNNYKQVYNEFILTTETRSLTQNHLNYLLLKDYGIPLLSFISALVDFKNNIELNGRWIRINPLERLLHWIDSSLDTSLKEELENIAIDKREEITSVCQNLSNWINGDHLPSINNIEKISKLAKFLNIKDQELKNMLFVSRFYQSIFHKITESFGEELATKLKEHFDLLKDIFAINFKSNSQNKFEDNILSTIFPSLQKEDIDRYLHKYIYHIRTIHAFVDRPNDYFTLDIKKKLNKLFFEKTFDYMSTSQDFFENLEIFLPTNRLNNKWNANQKKFYDIKYDELNDKIVNKISSPDFYEKTLIQLSELTCITNHKNDESENIYNDLINSLSEKYEIAEDPYICFIKARYFAQKMEYKQSTNYYLEALRYGKHQLGKHLKNIIREGLIVSAQATKENSLDLKNAKSPFTKFYIEAHLYGLKADQPEEINQYFLNDTKKEFDSYFTCLFHNKNESQKYTHAAFSLINEEKLKGIRTDYKNPDKTIRTIYPNRVSQLMHVCINKNKSAVKRLIKAGVDVNYLRPNDGATALIMALQNKAIEISALLIPVMSKEALNAKTIKHKNTAFSLAIENGYVAIVNLLISHGADINLKGSKDELTPLYQTLNHIFLAKKASGLITTCNISNPYDSFEERRKIFSHFHGVFDEDKEAKLDFQMTEHHIAIYNEMQKFSKNNYLEMESKMLKIFNILLEATPDLEINHKGHTVLTFSTEINDISLVKKLIFAGANKNHEVSIGIKAYHYAKQNNNKELCDLLAI